MTFPSPIKALLTRPIDPLLQALRPQSWLDDLRAQGIDTQWLALLTIAPVRHPAQLAALDAARADLGQMDALMFVSTSAALHFWTPDTIARWFALFAQGPECAPRLWTPGAGSAQVLQALGFPLSAIDQPAHDAPQMESETLWPVIAAQVTAPRARIGQTPSPFRALIVRGTDTEDPSLHSHVQGQGRPWLAQQVALHHGQVQFVVAYQRCAPQWNAHEWALAKASQTDATVWIFSSSQSIAQLAQLLPDAHWGQAYAVATHPRIATKAREIGFAHVFESQPKPQALARSLKSMAQPVSPDTPA